MFRRDKQNKLDNEGLRRMREAIRQRLEQEEAAAGTETLPAESAYHPTGAADDAPYTYESAVAETNYSYPDTTATVSTSPTPDEGSGWGVPATAPESPPVTTVAADATWSGTLKSSADIRIDGQIDGEIETEKTLYIAPAATVNATVRAATIVVAGQLDGQIDCRERLEVLPSGRVSGQITAGAIVVQEGAFLGGQLRMRGPDTTDQAELARPMLQRVR